jgi:TATA-binding protein-associated factor Taf7
MALGPVLDDGSLELVAGKQLQHLAENAGYSYHGGGSPPMVHVSQRKP